jgi:hypothetical protein
MSAIADYKIIQAYSYKNLSNMVLLHIKEGRQPLGNPYCDKDSHYQAVVKYGSDAPINFKLKNSESE